MTLHNGQVASSRLTTRDTRVQPSIPQTLPLRSLNWEQLAPFLGDAHKAVTRFDVLVGNIPDASLLLSPLTTNEAVLSSRIEGTQATLQDVLRFQAEGKAEGEKRDDIQEIINYRKATNTTVERMNDLPLSGRLIREAHKILLSGTRGKEKDPGNFRTGQVFIGSPGVARYIPPSPEKIRELFYNFEKYIHYEEKDVLVQLAILHAQFEIIHPFWDGNGRIGRLLMPLFLYHKKAIATPYFYLSEYLEKNRAQYYDSLNRITEAGDWEQWITFFLRAVVEQSHINANKAQAIIDLKEKTLLWIQEITHSQYAPQIANFIFANPVFSSTRFRSEAGVPRPSVTRLLNRLVNGGIIEKFIPGRGRKASVFVFPELIKLL